MSKIQVYIGSALILFLTGYMTPVFAVSTNNTDKRLDITEQLSDDRDQLIKQTEVESPKLKPVIVKTSGDSALELTALEGNQLELKDEKTRATTYAPISLNASNELVMTRKDGTLRIISVLPDAAAARLEQRGFSAYEKPAELKESETGDPVYVFIARRQKKVLGIFRTTFQARATVSAETGEIVDTLSAESSPVKRFIEMLSR